MRLNRFWLLACVSLIVFGGAPLQGFSASKDAQSSRQAKSTPKAAAKSDPKKTAKSSKKPKTVRTTVTRSSDPIVAARPSFATALGLRGQHDDLSLKSSVAMVVNQDTKEVYFEKNPSISSQFETIERRISASGFITIAKVRAIIEI